MTVDDEDHAVRQACRVLIVDDHDLVRTGLRAVLEADPALTVVAEASDGLRAVAAAEAQRPDVVVMDLQMPTMDGFEAIRRLRAAHAGIAILVLTMFDDDASVFAALRAGAHGYVLKGAPRQELRTAVVAVASGQSVFGSGIAARVRDVLLTGHAATDLFPELTRRERDVLDLLVDGRPVAAIARHLGVSDKTVRNNLSSILNKLHVTDRTAAIDIALKRNPSPGRNLDLDAGAP